jgi:hypothetical protein
MEKEVFKNVIGNELNRKLLQVASTEAEEVVSKDKMSLKNSPTELQPPEKGSIQMETVDHAASINNQDSVTCQEESCGNTEAGSGIKMASENAVCGQSSNHVTSWKEVMISVQGKKTIEAPQNVEHPREEVVEKTQKQLVSDKAMLPDSGDHDKDKQKEDLKVSEIMNKELNEKEVFTEMKDEKPDKENDVMEQEGKMEDDRAVSVVNDTMQNVADVEGSKNASLVSNEVCNALQKEGKEREELSFRNMNEGQMGMLTVTQEKINKDEAQEMSSSKETIKKSVRTEKAVGEQENQKTYEKEKSEADSKANNENTVKGFSGTEKRSREEQQQKEPHGDKRVLDLNYNATSFVMRGTPELSAQKSVEEVMENSKGKQTCTSQETGVKLNGKLIAKNSKTLAFEVALPQEISHETDQLQGILDTPVTEKPICTVFRGTIIRGAKREESYQRSEVMHSSQNQENSRVKDGNSFSTETAINDQLKQLEYKCRQTAQENPALLKPQTLKQQKQLQQTQLQNQTQKQQQEQNEMGQKKQQEERTVAKQSEQQQQQQKTQNMHKKEEKEQAQQKQVQQTQQPLKQKIQMKEKHEETQCTQQNRQHSAMNEQQKIHKQKVVEHVKQRQSQRNGNSQPNRQEQKRKKELKEELKQENEQQWQQEKKCKQQHMQSYKQEKERESMEKSEHENQQDQQSKWPQQEPKQMTQKNEEEKQKEQKQPDQGLHQQEPHRKQHSEEGEDNSAAGCGGTQGRSCPIYFGVKSYLHHFYDSAPVKDSQLYEDYTEVSHAIACRINGRFTDKGNCFLLWRERKIQKRTVKLLHFIFICTPHTCTVAAADIQSYILFFFPLMVTFELSLQETEDSFNCQEMAGHFLFH